MAKYSFQEKLLESEDAVMREIVEAIYKKWLPFLASIEYSQDQVFQRRGCDLEIVFEKPRGNQARVSVEEKVRLGSNAKYDDLLVEYLSNKERNTLGWGFTSEADWLSYIQFCPGEFVAVLILPMQQLKSWFSTNYIKYSDIESQTALSGTHYTTVNKAIPFKDDAFRLFSKAHGYFYARKNLVKPN